MEVGIAKAVNRLLWVSHHKEGAGLSAINSMKYRELQWVGVLKFIDHGHWKTLAQSAGKCGSAGRVVTVQLCVDVVKHVVESHYALRAFALLQQVGAVQ